MMTFSEYKLPRTADGKIDLATAFAAFDLFADLPRPAIERIASLSHVEQTYRGQTLIEEGDSSNALLIILGGKVEVQVESISPYMEIGLCKLGPGEVVGETSLLQNGERSATVVMLSAGEAASIPADKLRDYFNERPDIGLLFMRNLARIISRRLDVMNRRVMNYMRARYL